MNKPSKKEIFGAEMITIEIHNGHRWIAQVLVSDDANLIAAAPELLEALEQIADDKGNADFTINEIKQIAQNAIQKTKGGE